MRKKLIWRYDIKKHMMRLMTFAFSLSLDWSVFQNEITRNCSIDRLDGKA